MGRFLLATFEPPGHLHAYIGIAQRLVADGHDVAFFSPTPIGDRLAKAALHVPSFCLPRSTVASNAERGRTGSMTDRYQNPRYLLKWYRLSLLSRLREEVDALRAAVREFAPDAMCINPQFYAAAIVAEQEHVPWAGASTTLVPVTPRGWTAPFLSAMDELAADVDKFTKPLGITLRFARGHVLSPRLNIVFTVEAFAPAVDLGGAPLRHVGAVGTQQPRGDEPSFDWSALEARELVYVTGGTQAGFSLEHFSTIAQAFAGSDRGAIMSVFDDLTPAFEATLPPNVRALRYVPQSEVIRRSRAVVCHGGANTIMDCMMYGRPVLLIPRAHDQLLQAQFVARAGVGRVITIDELDSAGCRRTIDEMLATGSPELARAEAVAAAYRAAGDGNTNTARLLADLVAGAT